MTARAPSRESPFRLKSAAGATLHGVVHLPQQAGPRPAVVVCHGFKGFMEWGFFPPLATLLAERGFVAVRFNFSGAGQAPGDALVTDLEAFRADTPLRQRDETLRVLAALAQGELAADRVDPGRLGLVGHSRGGAAALLAAAAPEAPALGALVTWAAIAAFDRYDAATKVRWRADGELEVANARTGQVVAMGVGYLDEIETRAEEVDLLAAAARRTAPWLVVHAADDAAVPADDARLLAVAARPPVETRLLPEGGHTFGVGHPFRGPAPPLVAAMNATHGWLRRYLGG